ncbi:alpha/beta hydrolase [Brevibacillus sp. MER 51]|uniref:alpha/beta hydrolase n=1 Tax=Brevibacillus sp. MER 51 TaxID=2939560 RepID=UPI002041A131|nr:alpha/beta hydrolase [Brevibacillus sp. MER 51]MCM3143371.1 lysophospholipase [Brevibacillus sp. MER 51]
MGVHKWSAKDSQGAIVLVHGTGEHHGRYGHVAAYFNQAGWDVYAEDLPGWGRSPGRRGHIQSFEDYLSRVREWTSTALADASGEKPVCLMGHSLGGLIATRFIQTDERSKELAGLILTSPCLKLKLTVPAWKEQLAQFLDRVWPTLVMPNGITPDMVSRDEAVQAAYQNDPLNYSKVSVRWFTELNRSMEKAWAERNQIKHPVLVLQAGADSLVDADAVEQFTAGLSDRQTFERFAGLRHEILNEPEKEEVLQKIVSWLNDNISN